ncbi:MAG: DUF2617 family protein [Isosphaeraceae bacterium]
MGVHSGRARIADLSFQVYERALHPEWFATRVHRRIPRGRWEADVRIIAGGHVVNFATGAVRLTEVLSGPETILPEPGLLFHSGVRSERSARLESGGVVEYQSCFEVERVDPEVFRHLCAELVADGARETLMHHFGSSNRLSPAPLSRVHLDPRVRGLSVHSTHTFPEEFAVIHSQSLYELIDGPSEP